MPIKPRTAYEDTTVPVHKTRGEIDALLYAAGANGIMWAEGDHPGHPGARTIALRFIRQEQTAQGPAPIAVRVLVPVPKAKTPKEQEQLLRAYHRAMYYYLKAQFDAIARGLVEFTEAFMPHLEMGNGQTLYEHLGPQYLQAAVQGEIKPMALIPG